MIVFDDDEVDASISNINSGSVGKVMPRSVMLGALASAPDSLNGADSPSGLNGPENALCNAVADSVALDTLALTKDPAPEADDARALAAEQDSMQLFFDDSDMVEDSSTAAQATAAATAVAVPAAAAAPSLPSEAKVYGRKNRDAAAAGGITAFFAPAPKVVDAPLPAAVAEEENDNADADADADADDDDDDDGGDSDAGSVDSAASLARRLMEEQRRRQQEAFKVPVAAQVRKDIIDMVGEKGRCHIPPCFAPHSPLFRARKRHVTWFRQVP
jgi:hypothetical protein